MRAVLFALVILTPGAAFADGGADAFNTNCGACHGLDATSTPLAPGLKGIAGRKIASLTDFDYSDVLKAKGGTWTDQALDAFLTDPSTFAPGTKMFGGAPDPVQRKAIIDYLKTVK
ncbi:MAG: c-type cytochrome [Caulobacterales bacterium]